METQLPSRIYRARATKVANLGLLEVDLNLGFGVRVGKNLILEGVDAKTIPQARRSDAMHCLVMIAGGRKLLVHTEDDTTRDGFIRARVYLDAVPRGMLPAGMCQPHGMEETKVEVSLLFGWAATTGFDVAQVRDVMRLVEKD